MPSSVNSKVALELKHSLIYKTIIFIFGIAGLVFLADTSINESIRIIGILIFLAAMRWLKRYLVELKTVVSCLIYPANTDEYIDAYFLSITGGKAYPESDKYNKIYFTIIFVSILMIVVTIFIFGWD